MEKKYVVKSKIRKYPFICDMLLGFCAVYLAMSLLFIGTDKWNENTAKFIFFIFAIAYGFYGSIKRLITYRIISVTEKEFTIIRPFILKSKTYAKKYIKEIIIDDSSIGKKMFVDVKIYMNDGEIIVFSNREFSNFGELVKTFESKISTVKIEKLKQYF